MPPPDPEFLERAWSTLAAAAAQADVAVVVARRTRPGQQLLATVLVIDRDGTIVGFQDKVQLDPSEDSIYSPGAGAAHFRGWTAHIRHRNLPRRLALPRDGPLGRAPPRSSHSVPSTSPRSRTRQLRAYDFRRSCKLVSRESRALPRRREYLLLRNRKLCKSWFPDDISRGQAGRNAAYLSALRQRRSCSLLTSTLASQPASSRRDAKLPSSAFRVGSQFRFAGFTSSSGIALQTIFPPDDNVMLGIPFLSIAKTPRT